MRRHPLLANATTHRSLLVYGLLAFGVLIIMMAIPMPIWLKLFLFTVFAVLQGMFLHAATALLPKEVIDQALIGAIGIFVAFAVLGTIMAAFGIDLGFMGMILFGMLIGLLVASVVLLFLDKEKTKGFHKFLIIVGLVLFSLYIMYESNTMIQDNYMYDFVTAAVNLYLDFVNVFVNLVAAQSE